MPENQKVHDCKSCGDSHFVYPLKSDGSTDYSQVVPCECVREKLEREKRGRLLRWCELPEATEHMTFENFKRTKHLEEAYQTARSVAEEEEGAKWLTLMSEVYHGKTHLAVAICRRWLARGKPARYAYVPLLLEELRRGFREGGDNSYEARFDMFLNVPLLVLDDLGTENPTPWVQEKLDTIVDYRLMHGLNLVVTTNFGYEELPVRIASRLSRAGRIVLIEGPPRSTVKLRGSR